MSSYDPPGLRSDEEIWLQHPRPVVLRPAEVLERERVPTVVREYRPSVFWPIVLFVATCLTTYRAQGAAYAAALLTILAFHEMGHFVQARRWGVRSSYPLFIPMPLSPIGTMGAVILMRSNIPNRRALFDIGITGPLAGLVPALIVCIVGISGSTVVDTSQLAGGRYLELGEPLIFKFLVWLVKGPVPEGKELLLNGVAMAGWVGIFITAINLVPVSQLDGGHVLYALLGRRSYLIVRVLFLFAVVAVVVTGSWLWLLPLVIVLFIGLYHPPTMDDGKDIGGFRRALGWITLGFVVLGFTPDPLQVRFPDPGKFRDEYIDVVKSSVDPEVESRPGLAASSLGAILGGVHGFVEPDGMLPQPGFAPVDEVEDGEEVVERMGDDRSGEAAGERVGHAVGRTEEERKSSVGQGHRVCRRE